MNKEIVGKIILAINNEKELSLLQRSTGDYRIGLSKALDIIVFELQASVSKKDINTSEPHLPLADVSGSLPTREQIKSIIDDSLGCERFNCKGRGTCTNTVGKEYRCKAIEREIDLLLKLFGNDR